MNAELEAVEREMQQYRLVLEQREVALVGSTRTLKAPMVSVAAGRGVITGTVSPPLHAAKAAVESTKSGTEERGWWRDFKADPRVPPRAPRRPRAAQGCAPFRDDDREGQFTVDPGEATLYPRRKR